MEYKIKVFQKFQPGKYNKEQIFSGFSDKLFKRPGQWGRSATGS